MVGNLRRGVDVDAVAFEPERERVEIGIADRELIAHHPGPLEHLLLDQLEAGRLYPDQRVRYTAIQPWIYLSFW